MKKTKKRRLITITISSVIIIISIFALIYYFVGNPNRYTFAEKKWINDNLNNIIDVQVEKDLPIFALNGEGVYFDYIKDLENDTNISFNVTYNESNTNYLGVKNKINENDVVLYKDHYVVVSKNNNVLLNLNDLIDKKVATLVNDLEVISSYMKGYSSITYKTFTEISAINTALDSEDCDFAIIPLYRYIDTILKSSFKIKYHLDGLYSYYVLSLNEDNKELNNIMTKFFNRWNEELNNKQGEHFLKLYYDIFDFTEIEKESIIHDDFIVGYIQNLPYEGKTNRIFSGINSVYLEMFSDLTKATYKYVEYKSIDKLTKALNNKKVDIVYNPYSLKNQNYVASSNLGFIEYVVIAHHNSNIIINTLQSLNEKEVFMLDNMNLTKVLKDKNLFIVKEYEDIKKMFINIDEDTIIIVEKYVYDYYKGNKLKDFSIRYSDKILLNNNYLLLKDNTSFNQLFNFYLTLLSNQEVSVNAVSKTLKDLNTNIIISFILNNIMYVLLVVTSLLVLIYRLSRKVYISKRIKKEDRMLYLDVLTNLKNRNYLNDNIDYWEKNKIYPQAIVIMDLNKIKELNDKKGHEEGDRQIKAAASALIKTQRENSEIIRSDGNEFMVYLVGYDEKAVTSYLHKLNKELQATLPYVNYGAAIGYSMILDELKSIDDAINEAAIIMRKNKGSNNEKQN